MDRSLGSPDNLLRKRRGNGIVLAQKVNVNGKEYHVLSPIIIDFSRRTISFNVEREILGVDGQTYTIGEQVVIYDGSELRERKGPDGKSMIYSVHVARFSEVWDNIKDQVLDILKMCLEKNEQRKAQERGSQENSQNTNNKGA